MRKSPLLAAVAAIAAASLVTLTPAVAHAGTRTYRGDWVDPANPEGKPGDVVIKVKKKKKDGQKILIVRAECSPKKRCRVFRELKFKMYPAGEYWTGEFQNRFGSSCSIMAYVYKQGYQGSFNCEDGEYGALGGMR